MKNATLLVWLTQLGISVAVPPVCFILLAVWIRNRCQWGQWVIWVGIAMGIYCAVTGFISSLRSLLRVSEEKKDTPPVAFNNHD